MNGFIIIKKENEKKFTASYATSIDENNVATIDTECYGETVDEAKRTLKSVLKEEYEILSCRIADITHVLNLLEENEYKIY